MLRVLPGTIFIPFTPCCLWFSGQAKRGAGKVIFSYFCGSLRCLKLPVQLTENWLIRILAWVRLITDRSGFRAVFFTVDKNHGVLVDRVFEVVEQAMKFTQSLDKIQVGFSILHTIGKRGVLLCCLKTDGCGIEPGLLPDGQNNLGNWFVLEDTLICSVLKQSGLWHDMKAVVMMTGVCFDMPGTKHDAMNITWDWIILQDKTRSFML